MLHWEDRLQEFECSISCDQLRKRMVQLVQAAYCQNCGPEDVALMLTQTVGVPYYEARQLVRQLSTEWKTTRPANQYLPEVMMHSGVSATASSNDYDRYWQQLLA
ncbi:hypothetical protein [Leptolyngbya sp. FACHB-261]|uniref:hypothetical protein n=1 Tax=Leptolyngbya sp. FACHB-261 TaxID=2692806 RepID=UPI00168523E0|nr:hypothetical protein [Leptolyngbya sp. FACHB-261]MBD2103213.1 hypothetical protein [Leptolyngbya sp. FACHB-261]